MIDKLNNLDPHVWAIVVMLAGAGLVAMKQAESGKMLIAGGLAMFQFPNRLGGQK